MRVSYIDKKTVDNLNISVMIEDYIFFVKNNEIYKKNVHSYDESFKYKTQIKEKIDELIYFDGFLLILCGNILYKYRVLETELVFCKEFLLKEPPKRIFVVKNSRVNVSNAVCFLYKNKGIEIFTDKIEDITICLGGDLIMKDKIVDFCVSEEKSYFLSESGNVYKTHSFILSRTIFLGKPIKILPEPITFEGSAKRILVKSDKVFISYEDGFEMYKEKSNILVLDYTYKTKDHKLYVGEKNVYCAEKQLLVINKAPMLLADVEVISMYGDCGVTKNKILFILKNDDLGKSNKINLLKEQDPNQRVIETFRGLENITFPEFEIKDIKNTTEEKLLLIIQKILNEYEKNNLDPFRNIYFELVTLNDSFKEKKRILEEKKKAILDKAENFDKRKEKIIERMKSVNEKFVKFFEEKKIDGTEIKKKIKEINKLIENVKKNQNDEYKKILRIQRNLLSKKVFN